MAEANHHAEEADRWRQVVDQKQLGEAASQQREVERTQQTALEEEEARVSLQQDAEHLVAEELFPVLLEDLEAEVCEVPEAEELCRKAQREVERGAGAATVAVQVEGVLR